MAIRLYFFSAINFGFRRNCFYSSSLAKKYSFYSEFNNPHQLVFALSPTHNNWRCAIPLRFIYIGRFANSQRRATQPLFAMGLCLNGVNFQKAIAQNIN